LYTIFKRAYLNVRLFLFFIVLLAALFGVKSRGLERKRFFGNLEL